jgi:hypothetical protein
VGEHVIDGDQDFMRDCHGRAFVPTSSQREDNLQAIANPECLYHKTDPSTTPAAETHFHAQWCATGA